jgi:hypothetical protein
VVSMMDPNQISALPYFCPKVEIEYSNLSSFKIIQLLKTCAHFNLASPNDISIGYKLTSTILICPKI